MFERRRAFRQTETPGKARDFVIRPTAAPSLKHELAGPGKCTRHACGGPVPAWSIRK